MAQIDGAVERARAHVGGEKRVRARTTCRIEENNKDGRVPRGVVF